MMAVKTPFKSGILDGKLKDLRHEIERAIPVGFNAHKETDDTAARWNGWETFDELHEKVQDRKVKAMKQMGTLGGGNEPFYRGLSRHRRQCLADASFRFS